MLFQRNGQHWLVHTPAKLNLYLEIIDRREDGYHELETCMVSVDLFDTLRFRPDSASLPGHVSLVVRSHSATSAPADDSNLIVRAARALQQRTGCQKSVSIELMKRIPSQAGLGGGSSDAAATLVALNGFWNLGLTRQDLHEIAATLGSDINFFVEQTPAAICRGCGERVTPIRCERPLHFVVAHPGFGLSTKDVFAACSVPEQPRNVDEFVRGLTGGEIRLHNRLAEAAVNTRPEIRQIARTFDRAIAGPHQLTGSGSAWFGITPTRRAAVRSAHALRNAGLPATYAVSLCG